MSDPGKTPFNQFLEAGVAKGGFETDDVLAALLPLMKQVLGVHEAGLVAPIEGVRDLIMAPDGTLMFPPEKAVASRKNLSRVEKLQAPVSSAVEVVAELSRTADVDTASLRVSDLRVGAPDEEITKPKFLADYKCWECAVDHQDVLTDIFLLGQLLASVSCGLDFTDAGELEMFSANRSNLFVVNPRLNPVLASTILQMTELNRHKRAPDLAQQISRLEHYREQPLDLDFNRLQGFKESPESGKRRLIQSRLRDRLFEISRRNRLIYFKPNLQTLNLTVASVPILLDYRNIKRENLFVWHPELAAIVTEGAPMSLGKYLRFEDAPYISGVLDKIISEARRDRAEFGFAQLKLVLCFIRWSNLKEAPGERIHSPLLLLPVELIKKKGVRDNYVLDPTTNEAEVNPALRHHLKELYNFSLPEFVDLRETSLDQFYEMLKAQIQASEPGVTLNKIDRPQIQLIHEKARQRVDQYRRRIKLQARHSRASARPDYSYDREHYRPLGLQLFLDKVRPAPAPMRDVAGAAPEVRLPHLIEPSPPGDSGKVLETEREMFSLREGGSQNPYSWDFDLCNLTLGNFNYRKMTLVRDYSKLIETDMQSQAFDDVFSLNPKPAEETPPPPLALADQHLVIACDATQASAIARARTGASYIIQGPPGTGKSQTITNLIADYVARGQRVLFVCEKRAAIDIVFHRLRQQGLDELCCLIHDSQTDKKSFIQNLKQTYEKFLGQSDLGSDVEGARNTTLRLMENDLESLRRFSGVMTSAHERTGIPVRSLLHRLVELRGRSRDQSPELDELLPDYALWKPHGDVINRLQAALADLGQELCFARHPIRWLGKGILEADRPLEALTMNLDRAEDLLDAIGSALELSGLPGELWDTFEEIQSLLEFAVRARPLAERNLLGVLVNDPACEGFETLGNELDAKTRALDLAREKTVAWREPLSAADTRSALELAERFEKSIFKFLQPAYWRLKKVLQTRYDFTRHVVAPPWSAILRDLAEQHAARTSLDQVCHRAREAWQVENVDGFRSQVAELKNDRLMAHPSIKELLGRLLGSADGISLIGTLCEIHERFTELDHTLRSLLAEHSQFEFPELTDALAKLRQQSGVLAELSPILMDLAELPANFGHALRRANVPLNDFEASMGQKSINSVYREDCAISRFTSRVLAVKMEKLEKHYREWFTANSRCIRAAARKKFLEHVNISILPAAQLSADQKIFKKSYSAGRRDLEHEFGKTMRYKSIRDLAAGDTGKVIQDLKPIWLMSPLSVSDTLPLDPDLFDVVIFDEASQIPLEEAVPAIYRTHQSIVVGDEMQLPPTTFFAGARGDDESLVLEEEGERIELALDSDSFLSQSAINLPSTLLAWHYRSRYEALISFSNSAFYSGNLFTIPDRQCGADNQDELIVTANEQAARNVEKLLSRSISFHFMENGVYEDRRNRAEAAYIAQIVRGLLLNGTKHSIGVVAFSEAQQSEIDKALSQLAEEDQVFADLLEGEYVREENDVFCGLFVKNLENVQGDERDIIIMSVCYAPDANGRMVMNFGPINQRGGEKRLNVIFSRAKLHMAIVSSIRYQEITNDYNDGANNLKSFLQYAEAVSKGDAAQSRRVLENLNPLSRKALSPLSKDDVVVEKLAAALRERGYEVGINVGQSKFRCDLGIRHKGETFYQLGILVDTDGHYSNSNLLDRYLMQPAILKGFGWRIAMVLTKDWYHTPEDVIARIEKMIKGQEVLQEMSVEDEEPLPTAEVPAKIPVNASTAESSPNQTAAKVPPSLAAKAPLSKRYFEYIQDTSRKFWEISFHENTFTVRFGRIGALGQSQTKTFATEDAAASEAENLIEKKVKSGYAEKNP